MSRIVDKNAKYRVDLGNDEWIDVRAKLTFNEFTQVSQATGADDMEMMKTMLKLIIKDWHLLDDAGVPVPFNPELISDFDIDTVSTTLKVAMEQYIPQKKSTEQLPG